MSRACLFCSRWSISAAFGMAMTSSRRNTHAKATGSGCTPCALGDGSECRLVGQPTLFDRAVRHNGHGAAGHPGQQVEFGAAADEVVQHLIGRAGPPADRDQLRHVRRIEIAHPPMADLAGPLQGLHRLDGLGQRHPAAPMEQVKVETVGVQPAQALLAGLRQPVPAGILRIDLADQEHFVAQTGQGFGQQGFGGAVAVHLRRVDQGQTQFDAFPNRGDLGGAARPGLAEPPCPLAEGRHGFTAGRRTLRIGFPCGD